MPIPKPYARENQAEYLTRSMTDPAMKNEFPDQKDRRKICLLAMEDYYEAQMLSVKIQLKNRRGLQKKPQF